MLNSLITPVNTIFIMLGEKCNCDCRYCLQHVTTGLVEKMSQEINSDIYDFIRGLAFQRQGKANLTLEFFGGEPLVYLPSIKEIIKNTENIPNIKYAMMSNGKLLDNETVEYLNKKNVSIGISWDGRSSSYTRKYDVMKENLDNILSIKNLWLSAVMSKYSYPQDILDDFNIIKKKYDDSSNKLKINIDEIFDTGVSDKDLFDISYDKIYYQMNNLCKKYMSNLKDGKLNTDDIEISYIHSKVNSIKSWYKNPKKLYRVRCGSGISVINMDLSGNFYNCHNSSTIVGNIYEPYQNVLDTIMQMDSTEYWYEHECKNCPVISVCHGGCKLIDSDKRKQYCNIKTAVILPIINNILKLEGD